jgi:hypothetical protein
MSRGDPSDAGIRGAMGSPALPPRPPSAGTSPFATAQPTGTTATPAWYRSDVERSRSVYRLANPWWRRSLRAAVALCLLAIAGVGLYAGARALQRYLDRDRLPDAGVEIPEYRSTVFQLRSTPPGPDLSGTLTLDVGTGAFEFIGRPAGGQAGVRASSVDGTAVHVSRDGGAPVAETGTTLVRDLRSAIAHLAAVDTADDVLTQTIRDGYAELVDRTTEGDDDTALTRYQLTLDTGALAQTHPLEWELFRQEVIPAADGADALAVTIWLDGDGVLVRLRDDTTGWTWERLTYSPEPFAPGVGG